MVTRLTFTEALGQGKVGWAPTMPDLFFGAQGARRGRRSADSLLSPARHFTS